MKEVKRLGNVNPLSDVASVHVMLNSAKWQDRCKIDDVRIK